MTPPPIGLAPNRAFAGRAHTVAALGAVDRLVLVYLCVLAAIVLVRNVSAPGPLPWIGATALALLAVAVWSERSSAGRLFHDYLPIALVVVLFNLSGAVTEVANPLRGDALLASLDDRLFGPLVTAWRYALGRPSWLTDAASVVYLSFYFVPVIMAVALYRRSDRRVFDAFTFDVVAAFLVSFLGYLALPATGPRLPESVELAWLGGGRVTSAAMAFLHVVERNRLDAFPSGHAAISLVVLALGWSLFPRWRLPLALVTAGIVFATVYLSLHYVIDLVAGAALAGAMPVILPLLRRCFHAPRLDARRGDGAMGW